jgi:protein-disulfide isomerase
MKKQQKKGSNLPYIIIGIVLVAVIGAVAVSTGIIGENWFGSGSSNTAVANANRSKPANTSGATRPPVNAPSGASLGVNMLGSPAAIVTVEEFADYQCSGCASMHSVMKEVQSAYAGNKNFRFIYRHFPLPAHDKSFEAAVATEAAGLQGKFWQMQDLLFRNQQAWTGAPNYREIWAGYAASIGMDVERFKADMSGTNPGQRVQDDLARGRALNVTSTPTIFVNGQAVPSSDSFSSASLRRIIDAEIQQALAASQSATPGSSQAAGNSQAANTASK